MFIGYADDHANGTFKMLNMKTRPIWMTRDICWVAANIVKYDEMSNNPPTKKNDDDDGDNIVKTRTNAQAVNNDNDDEDEDDEDDDNSDNDADDDANDDEDDDKDDANNDFDNKDNDTPPKALSQTFHAMRKLVTSYNPHAMDYVDRHCPSNDNDYNDTTIQQDNQSGRDEEDDEVEAVKPNLASLAIDPLPDFAFYAKEKVEIKQLDFAEAFEHHLIELTTFQDAYHHLDPSQGKKWCEAIKKEFRMTHCGKVNHSTIPQGRQCIKSKWGLQDQVRWHLSCSASGLWLQPDSWC